MIRVTIAAEEAATIEAISSLVMEMFRGVISTFISGIPCGKSATIRIEGGAGWVNYIVNMLRHRCDSHPSRHCRGVTIVSVIDSFASPLAC